MSETTSSLQRKLATAAELHSVVRTMKAMAASRIGQYRDAVTALDSYYRTVQLGLALCLRQDEAALRAHLAPPPSAASVDAIVFGTDQGMVGQFNDTMFQYVIKTLAPMAGEKTLWPVGERIAAHFAEGTMQRAHSFNLPVSTQSIPTLVGKILIALDAQPGGRRGEQVFVFHHRPVEGGGFAPACQRLLPLDAAWMEKLAAMPW